MGYDRSLSFIFRCPTKIVFGEGVAGDVGSELTYVAVIRDHQKKRKLLFEDGLEEVADHAISDGAIVYNPKPMDPDENLKVLKQAW